jgi:DNA modification methylase
MAAHRQGRIGVGIDISPAYIDVTVERWQRLSGEAARLDRNGRTFAEIAKERSDGKAAAAAT